MNIALIGGAESDRVTKSFIDKLEACGLHVVFRAGAPTLNDPLPLNVDGIVCLKSLASHTAFDWCQAKKAQVNGRVAPVSHHFAKAEPILRAKGFFAEPAPVQVAPSAPAPDPIAAGSPSPSKDDEIDALPEDRDEAEESEVREWARTVAEEHPELILNIPDLADNVRLECLGDKDIPKELDLDAICREEVESVRRVWKEDQDKRVAATVRWAKRLDSVVSVAGARRDARQIFGSSVPSELLAIAMGRTKIPEEIVGKIALRTAQGMTHGQIARDLGTYEVKVQSILWAMKYGLIATPEVEQLEPEKIEELPAPEKSGWDPIAGPVPPGDFNGPHGPLPTEHKPEEDSGIFGMCVSLMRGIDELREKLALIMEGKTDAWSHIETQVDMLNSAIEDMGKSLATTDDLKLAVDAAMNPKKDLDSGMQDPLRDSERELLQLLKQRKMMREEPTQATLSDLFAAAKTFGCAITITPMDVK